MAFDTFPPAFSASQYSPLSPIARKPRAAGRPRRGTYRNTGGYTGGPLAQQKTPKPARVSPFQDALDAFDQIGRRRPPITAPSITDNLFQGMYNAYRALKPSFDRSGGFAPPAGGASFPAPLGAGSRSQGMVEAIPRGIQKTFNSPGGYAPPSGGGTVPFPAPAIAAQAANAAAARPSPVQDALGMMDMIWGTPDELNRSINATIAGMQRDTQDMRAGNALLRDENAAGRAELDQLRWLLDQPHRMARKPDAMYGSFESPTSVGPTRSIQGRDFTPQVYRTSTGQIRYKIPDRPSDNKPAGYIRNVSRQPTDNSGNYTGSPDDLQARKDAIIANPLISNGEKMRALKEMTSPEERQQIIRQLRDNPPPAPANVAGSGAMAAAAAAAGIPGAGVGAALAGIPGMMGAAAGAPLTPRQMVQQRAQQQAAARRARLGVDSGVGVDGSGLTAPEAALLSRMRPEAAAAYLQNKQQMTASDRLAKLQMDHQVKLEGMKQSGASQKEINKAANDMKLAQKQFENAMELKKLEQNAQIQGQVANVVGSTFEPGADPVEVVNAMNLAYQSGSKNIPAPAQDENAPPRKSNPLTGLTRLTPEEKSDPVRMKAVMEYAYQLPGVEEALSSGESFPRDVTKYFEKLGIDNNDIEKWYDQEMQGNEMWRSPETGRTWLHNLALMAPISALAGKIQADTPGDRGSHVMIEPEMGILPKFIRMNATGPTRIERANADRAARRLAGNYLYRTTGQMPKGGKLAAPNWLKTKKALEENAKPNYAREVNPMAYNMYDFLQTLVNPR